MVNSRNKGACGERELANELTKLGLPAYRGQQYQGGADSADVRFRNPALDEHLNIECKRYKQLKKLQGWQQQAKDDAGDKIPVLATKFDNGEWWLSVPLKQLIPFINTVMEA